MCQLLWWHWFSDRKRDMRKITRAVQIDSELPELHRNDLKLSKSERWFGWRDLRISNSQIGAVYQHLHAKRLVQGGFCRFGRFGGWGCVPQFIWKTFDLLQVSFYSTTGWSYLWSKFNIFSGTGRGHLDIQEPSTRPRIASL